MIFLFEIITKFLTSSQSIWISVFSSWIHYLWGSFHCC